MKTINAVTKKIMVIVGIVMAILILLVFNTKAADHNDPKKDLRYQSEIIKVEETVKNYLSRQEVNFEGVFSKKVFKFFDEEENLLFQWEINADKVADNKKLVKYLHQSDLVMNLGYTSFYRFTK